MMKKKKQTLAQKNSIQNIDKQVIGNALTKHKSKIIKNTQNRYEKRHLSYTHEKKSLN